MERKQHIEVLKFMSHVSENESASSGWNAYVRGFIELFHNGNFPHSLTYSSVLESAQKNEKLRHFLQKMPISPVDKNAPDPHQMNFIFMVISHYYINVNCKNFFLFEKNKHYTLFIDDLYCLNLIEVDKGYQLNDILNIQTKEYNIINKFLSINHLKSFLHDYSTTCEMNSELIEIWFFN